MNREQALRRLQILDFAIQETALFLNAHPQDAQAMQYYQSTMRERKEAFDEYERCYGPLSSRDNQTENWEYIKGPWPWEREE